MKKSVFAGVSLPLAFVFFIGMCFISRADEKSEADIALARQASGELGKTLKMKMQDAVQRHSFTGALAVCQQDAPAIAAGISMQHDIVVRRVSTKVRNPANQPDEWEQAGLLRLEEKINSGTDPATAEESGYVANLSGEKEFRYLKAIVVEPLCLTCHGEVLEDAMKAELTARYPEDTATGYQAGQLRGAFSVTIPPGH